MVQQAAVSQISIFGVSADLTPLVVMSVGLLAARWPARSSASASACWSTWCWSRRSGVTSLLYIAIGYWAGRLRELRDPAHGLVPLAVGAPATAFAGIGMALIQFLLGVDAPVSLLLLQQIFITVLVNTLIALPVYALVRRIIRPALPDDPRRRRRRAYTTGGLSPLQQGAARRGAIPRPRRDERTPEDNACSSSRRRAAAADPAARAARGDHRELALAMFAIIFFRLWFLQVLSGDQYAQAASANFIRPVEVAAPARPDRRPQRHRRSP